MYVILHYFLSALLLLYFSMLKGLPVLFFISVGLQMFLTDCAVFK